jgi:glycosyltransferase involved in cell wall biosynthesis
MKVLFVSSGNSEHFEIAPFIKSQGESLVRAGVDIDYFSIKGKGIGGYRKNVSLLKQYVQKTDPDIIHAHYSLSGWVVVLARLGKPMVLSLMGTDTHGGVAGEKKTTLKARFRSMQVKRIQHFYPALVVKSENLRTAVWKDDACFVIPNGVNYQVFKPLDKKECRKKLKLPADKKLILFMAKTHDANKNFALLEKAKPYIKTENIEFVTPYPVPHDQVPLYYNACDVLAFTSRQEGSPNVIKEALACNTPIVATPSGDILERTKGLKSVLISEFDEKDLAAKLDQMLSSGIKENAREKVRPQIDEELIAGQIIDIYQKLLQRG